MLKKIMFRLLEHLIDFNHLTNFKRHPKLTEHMHIHWMIQQIFAYGYALIHFKLNLKKYCKTSTIHKNQKFQASNSKFSTKLTNQAVVGLYLLQSVWDEVCAFFIFINLPQTLSAPLSEMEGSVAMLVVDWAYGIWKANKIKVNKIKVNKIKVNKIKVNNIFSPQTLGAFTNYVDKTRHSKLPNKRGVQITV